MEVSRLDLFRSCLSPNNVTHHAIKFRTVMPKEKVKNPRRRHGGDDFFGN